jgi:hypothetical protein
MKEKQKNLCSQIQGRYFFNKDTYSNIFTCYTLRVTKKTKYGKVRGWLFNGSMKEVWVPYRDLKFTMRIYSMYLDFKDKMNGKILIGND